MQSYYERGFEMKESPSGWVTGALMEAGISYREIWDTLGYLAQDQVSIFRMDSAGNTPTKSI